MTTEEERVTRGVIIKSAQACIMKLNNVGADTEYAATQTRCLHCPFTSGVTSHV